MLKIGFRTIKTAVGVSISVLLGELLGLQNFASAGILTLLCVQKSRKRSIQAAVSRFFACLGGMFISTGIFELIGYHAYSFLVLLLLFIPLVVRFKIQEGIASSAVIMMHVYMHGKVEASFFLNEFLIVVIGLGVALLVNWYMPSIDRVLVKYQEETERLISAILLEIANYLKSGYTLWDGKELLLLEDTLAKARSVAALDAENHRTIDKRNDYGIFFENKRRQYHLLERMLPMVSRITAQMEQSNRIGDFVIQLSEQLRQPDKSGELNDKLRTIREYHKQLPLPQTREEFENRASLFTMANELERFIDTI
ncbi:aromatic acid exporter family protein [Cohnella sp. AR92]|uniref:aromatic acid exporter family protein n=1 Tax=Cohnella sp. AR92 TaxID=648716 RepID=UPI000F8E3D80|nr:aromatic acid exporter family protein [Cohnella sp. AR92]RUS41936.1 aromatic acid exporter family protein [Cohnella sp. AR92]